jgi:chemotaxis protein methyltransferase WspC
VPAHHQLKPGKALTHSTTFGGSFRASQPQLLAKPAPARQRPDSHAGQAKLETAQRLADAGKLSDAAALSETHLREHGPCAHAYYLIGRARDAAGEAIQAATCYRKALYLEPQHSPAMLQLALLAEKDGDITTARRLRQRMQRVAKQDRAVG